MKYFDDLQVGEIFELGSYTLSKEEMLEFALKYDPQPFHIDEEKAKDSIYGELIASGWQSTAVYMKLFVDHLMNRAHGMGSPGLEELKWKRPVFAGDTLRGRFIILEKSKFRANLGLVMGKNELINQKDEIVMSFKGKMLFLKRENS
ncbi:MaoC family dehydratase [Leptospira kmetyi]|uniref:Acyl dehydratase n=1 Tax=Leptospira kmetyi TaxID=408139 RepID=A0ABX4NCQ8_9LEPT|nr:MaoC family dehydratase [Leptospira kmetyi]EQA53430.1 MaoC-like protein [Leptospira kmetyi serovar Malaysia str. Bejo-Iso9]PJZ31144.1 acyl dehydratase [Leptospira kmetyi]PJZ43481.1 acyl dehydratase [Leptospira kmetyi]TGK21777.1 MaoC family dehydratase [Leptospira kmetyi]TGK28704.1 MaoC family dehydratase [Leptospira kmetyi]